MREREAEEHLWCLVRTNSHHVQKWRTTLSVTGVTEQYLWTFKRYLKSYVDSKTTTAQSAHNTQSVLAVWSARTHSTCTMYTLNFLCSVFNLLQLWTRAVCYCYSRIFQHNHLHVALYKPDWRCPTSSPTLLSSTLSTHGPVSYTHLTLPTMAVV